MRKQLRKTAVCFSVSLLLLFFISIGNQTAASEEALRTDDHSLIDYKNHYVEYHSYVTGETLTVNATNEAEILCRIEQDRLYDGAEHCVISDIARNRLSDIFDFEPARNLASNSYTIDSVNTISQSPYSGICQIYSVYKDQDNTVQYISLGSGCFVSENAILTTAHCIKHATYGMPSTIRIYYCFELTPSGGDPFGNLAFCSATSSIICSTYYTNQDTMYDYAVLNVASCAGSTTGVFMLANMTPTTSMELMAIGYPAATSADGYGTTGSTILSNPNPMKVFVGNLNKIASDYLRADQSSLDIEDGMSGGALTKLNSNNCYELLGILERTKTVMFIINYSYFCRVESNVKAFCAYYGGTNSVDPSLYLTG